MHQVDSQDRSPLAPRQRDVVIFIREFIEAKRYSPTIREIGDGMGMISSNGVHCHVSALEKKGYLTRQARRARTIRLIGCDDITAEGR